MQEKVTEIIEDLGANQFFHDDVDFELIEQYEVQLIEQYGGEGDGDTYYTVYKFTDRATKEVLYARFDGWYASHYGSEYESWKFVTPVERTVTFYE